jgi:hypothetical protein
MNTDRAAGHRLLDGARNRASVDADALLRLRPSNRDGHGFEPSRQDGVAHAYVGHLVRLDDRGRGAISHFLKIVEVASVKAISRVGNEDRQNQCPAQAALASVRHVACDPIARPGVRALA